MTNQRSIALLLLGAVVMVVAVFAALRFAGTLSGSGDVPSVAMSKVDVEKIVKNYLLENPEIIFEAVDRMKAKESDQRLVSLKDNAKAHASQLYREAEPIVVGNPKHGRVIVQ